MKVGLGWLLGAASLLTAPPTAFAHPLVDEGRRLYEEAQFVEALGALGRADAATNLDRDEVLALLETRALVHLAMGNHEAMQQDLTRLVVIAPDYEPDRRFPPDVRRVIAEARAASSGPPRLRASPEPASTGVTITAEAQNDPHGLVRRVRILGREAGAAEWLRADNAPLLVPLTASSVAEYRVEALGPGGAVIAVLGTAEDPLRATGSVVEPGAEDGNERVTVHDDGDDEGGAPVWPWIAAGVGVAAVAAVLVILFVPAGGDPDSQPQPFTVTF